MSSAVARCAPCTTTGRSRGYSPSSRRKPYAVGSGKCWFAGRRLAVALGRRVVAQFLMQRWVSAQAERRPEATAIVMDGVRLSYAELDTASNRLARTLRTAGCDRGDRVCLLLPKSPAAIVS